MGCSVCDDYDIFNYMEIGFVALMLILLVALIINEIVYAKKINKIERELKRIKSLMGIKL